MVETPLGRVVGTDYGDFLGFKGLPFAETPERFEAPQAKRPWTGTWDGATPRTSYTVACFSLFLVFLVGGGGGGGGACGCCKSCVLFTCFSVSFSSFFYFFFGGGLVDVVKVVYCLLVVLLPCFIILVVFFWGGEGGLVDVVKVVYCLLVVLFLVLLLLFCLGGDLWIVVFFTCYCSFLFFFLWRALVEPACGYCEKLFVYYLVLFVLSFFFLGGGSLVFVFVFFVSLFPMKISDISCIGGRNIIW